MRCSPNSSSSYFHWHWLVGWEQKIWKRCELSITQTTTTGWFVSDSDAIATDMWWVKERFSFQFCKPSLSMPPNITLFDMIFATGRWVVGRLDYCWWKRAEVYWMQPLLVLTQDHMGHWDEKSSIVENVFIEKGSFSYFVLMFTICMMLQLYVPVRWGDWRSW